VETNIPALVCPIAVWWNIEDICRQRSQLVIIDAQRALHFVSSGKVLEEVWHTYAIVSKAILW
jgi:hypothetical protein